ncbi:MAG TPA: hypothetical protein VFR27_08495 [Mycobacterium sp.]|nr:hypothetical protein [Mycobacterium sp.]
MAMATLVGALTLVSTAPQAAIATSPAVALATSSSFQPALDSLLDAMRQAVAYDSALPFATPDGVAMLMTGLQNTNYELLMSGISRVTELFNGWFFQSPETVAGDAANPRQYFQFFTPDIYYHVTAGLAPGATYQLTGTLGGGTEALAIATEAITGSQAVTKSSLELGSNLVVNPDGTFTVTIGPSDTTGAVNFFNDTDATVGGDASLLIRDMLGNWAQGPADLSIKCISDCPAFFAIPTGGFFPSDDGTDAATGTTQITSIDSLLTTLFSAFATIVPSFNQMNMGLAEIAGIQLPANTMGDLTPETSLFATGLPSADVSAGNFDLAAGQALIVKVPDVPAAYSGIELMNVYGAGLPSTLSQTTLNNTTAFHDADGYTYYVVSATNPGVANWLDSSGVPRGEIFARFEGLPSGTDPTGLPVSTQLVPVADVANHLPADTPTVSGSEYAADMAQRVFSYDYALDVSRMQAQPDWLIQQLLLHGLAGAMGSDNFAAVFGAEDATPMALRLTPALSPDWSTVVHDLFTNPSASLSAIVHNLPLAFSDIRLPIELAVADLALAVLMPQQLPAALTDPLFDPNTSITAGLLNARDDLATAVLTANSDFPTQLGQLATQEWANMAELVQSVIWVM